MPEVTPLWMIMCLLLLFFFFSFLTTNHLKWRQLTSQLFIKQGPRKECFRTRLATSSSKLKVADCNKDKFLLLLFHQSSMFLHKRDINNRRGGTLFFLLPTPSFSNHLLWSELKEMQEQLAGTNSNILDNRRASRCLWLSAYSAENWRSGVTLQRRGARQRWEKKNK